MCSTRHSLVSPLVDGALSQKRRGQGFESFRPLQDSTGTNLGHTNNGSQAGEVRPVDTDRSSGVSISHDEAGRLPLDMIREAAHGLALGFVPCLETDIADGGRSPAYVESETKLLVSP